MILRVLTWEHYNKLYNRHTPYLCVKGNSVTALSGPCCCLCLYSILLLGIPDVDCPAHTHTRCCPPAVTSTVLVTSVGREKLCVCYVWYCDGVVDWRGVCGAKPWEGNCELVDRGLVGICTRVNRKDGCRVSGTRVVGNSEGS